MPVKLGSKLPTESAEARIEIVPLIDIMFFLLASFMLVSLSMVNMKSVKVNLPTAVTATQDVKRDMEKATPMDRHSTSSRTCFAAAGDRGSGTAWSSAVGWPPGSTSGRSRRSSAGRTPPR